MQLKREPLADQLSGSVEEVDTGQTVRFQSGEELLKFLRNKQEDHPIDQAQELAEEGG